MGSHTYGGFTRMNDPMLAVTMSLHAVELEAASRLYIFKGINVCFSSVLKAGGCLNQCSEYAGTKEYAVYY